MPIYEYRCADCGHQKEFLQKISDAPIGTCPACGSTSFSKMLTAAGFQLKGSGWYATDFKGGANRRGRILRRNQPSLPRTVRLQHRAEGRAAVTS